MINPKASIGVVTLWSRIDFVIKRFHQVEIDLDPITSKIAVIGNLYGRGFKYLIRNLLNNPQISGLLVFGTDSSNSYSYIVKFFTDGIEPIQSHVEYVSDGDQKIEPVRIVGTDCVMDNLVRPEMFVSPPQIFRVEGITLSAAKEAGLLIDQFEPGPVSSDRIAIEVPDVKTTYFPSNLRSYTIVDDNPSDAWMRLIHRIFRFGKRVQILKGERLELQNLKVVVEQPHFEKDERLKELDFDPDDFRLYQKRILSAAKGDDEHYNYGNRIRGYFGIDNLARVVDTLKTGLDDRKAYITLWDNVNDIGANHTPCLVSLFFRRLEGRLHLTATYRTHNAEKAWLENVYGLMSLQNFVVKGISEGGEEVSAGSITVISHSISLNPESLEMPKVIHDKVARKNTFRDDPNGYFIITTDGTQIVLKHLFNGETIGEYRSDNPLKIQYHLYRDCALSDINHAMYIGRQLEKAYNCIQEGKQFNQEE